jgi:predicted nucleic acid-binding protein
LSQAFYWDTSVFLCFLNEAEAARRSICEDILRHAKNGEVHLFTSTFTIVEVIRPKKVSIPNARLLTADEINEIEKMFRWSWLEKVPVDQQIAFKAVELARDYALWPADAVHAASAMRKTADVLHAWDRDFNSISHLIAVSEPTALDPQGVLIPPPAIGPNPAGFKPRP